jgi:hypothetical protein
MKKSTTTAVWVLLLAGTWGRATAPEGVSQLAQFRSFPESLLLAQGEERDLVWVIRNPNDKELSVLGIHPLAADGVEVSVPQGPSEQVPLVIAARSDSALVVKVRCTAEIREEQKVYLQLDCLLEGARQKAFDGLKVGPRTALPVERVASLTVETQLQTINEHCPGWVYLVVTNKSNQPITVGPPRIRVPESVKVPRAMDRTFTLPGQDTQTIPVKISVNNKVQPGNALLVFDVAVKQTQNGQERVYHLIQKHPVTLGVMGESEILKVLQIPSFLLLPGALAVMTVGFLWRRFTEPPKKDNFPLPYQKEDFWLVAITASIAIGFAYPYFTGWCLGEERNYLYGYGITDVVWVWILGIGAGLSSAILYTLYRKGRGFAASRRKEAEEAELRYKYPTINDEPRDVLSKLQRQGLPLGLPRVRLKDQQVLFVLQEQAPRVDKYWLGSEITITLRKDLDQAVEKEITDQLVLKGSPQILLRRLQTGDIETMTQAGPPVQTAASEIQKWLEEQVFVRTT